MEERDIAGTPAVVVPDLGAQDARPRPASRVGAVLRVLMVILYLGAAWPLVIDPNKDGGFPQDLIVGLLLAGMLLAVVAAVAFGIKRWSFSRRQSDGLAATAPRFRQSLTSVPVVVIALALAGLSAAGRQAQQQQQRKALAASDASSANPLDRDRGALAAWITAVPGSVRYEALAVHQIALLRQGLGAKSPDLTKLVSEARTANHDAALYAAAVEREPAATPDVRAVKALQEQSASDFAGATSDYLRGLQERDLKLLDQGDNLRSSSYQLSQQTSQRGEALYQRLGGYRAFGSRIDFQAYANAVQQAQQAANP
jgi:hypothetical protein